MEASSFPKSLLFRVVGDAEPFELRIVGLYRSRDSSSGVVRARFPPPFDDVEVADGQELTAEQATLLKQAKRFFGGGLLE